MDNIGGINNIGKSRGVSFYHSEITPIWRIKASSRNKLCVHVEAKISDVCRSTNEDFRSAYGFENDNN